MVPVLGILSGLLPLILIAAIIAAVVVARRAHDDDDDEPGIGTVRRLFLYGVALLALIFMASGVALLIAASVDALVEDAVAGARDSRFPLGLAFLIVGGPVWAGCWLISTRVMAQHPVEHRSVVRWLYLGLVRGIALIVIMVAGINAGGQIVRAQEVNGAEWGWLVAGAIAWAFHTRMVALAPASSDLTRSTDRLYRAFGSVAGLLVLAVAGGILVTGLLDYLYDALFLPRLVGDTAGDLWSQARMPLVAMVVGTAVWAWHWLRDLRLQAGTTLWLVYIFLFGILGGAATALTAAAVLIYNVLEWFAGVPRAETASAHFEFLPGALGALLIGAGLWGYHRVVQREMMAGGATWSEPERIYRYLVAAAGLIAFAGGLVSLLATFIDVVAPDAPAMVRDEGWWRNPLVLAVTFMAVGAPLWARYWFQAQRHVAVPGERGASSRRIFIFGIFGIAALVALGSLVHVLFTFLDAAFESTLGWRALHDTRFSIALVVTAGMAGVYYWLVLREDQRALAQEAPAEATPEAVRARDVLLVAPGDARTLASTLRERLDVRVRLEQRLDAPDGAPALSEEQVGRIASGIRGAGAERVLVLLAPNGTAEVVPYRRGPA